MIIANFRVFFAERPNPAIFVFSPANHPFIHTTLNLEKIKVLNLSSKITFLVLNESKIAIVVILTISLFLCFSYQLSSH